MVLTNSPVQKNVDEMPNEPLAADHSKSPLLALYILPHVKRVKKGKKPSALVSSFLQEESFPRRGILKY